MPDQKWISLVCGSYVAALLLPALAHGAVPDPDVLWWKFDEGTGTVAADSSGKGHDGVITGAQWKSGGVGGTGSCLNFDGKGTMTVEDKNAPSYLNGLEAITVSLWVKSRVTGTDKGFIIGEPPAGNDSFATMRYDAGGASFGGSNILKMAVTSSPGGEQQLESSSGLQTTEWHHVAMTWKGGDLIRFYSNGKEDTPSGRNGPNNAGTVSGVKTLIVGKGGKDTGATGWDGWIDDVRIYSTVLTAAQIAELTTNKPIAYKASEPNPADGTVGVGTPLLQWKKGDTAVCHNVYLGTTPDLTEANLAGKNQPFAMFYAVAGLQPGATYYWRVDEIEADMTTVRTGEVWSFIAQDVKAYYPTPVDQSPDVAPAGMLNWYAGQAAIKHHLYFGTSLDDVTKGTAVTDKGELTDATYALTGLDSLATYYWRVDELAPGGATKTGSVWSFTTYRPVDDFESYNDDLAAKTTIFDTWIDGLTNGLSGSIVGNSTAPFAEQTIVHQGKQSMPMDYNNIKAPFYSEAYEEFAPVQNWTVSELSDLRLDFRGAGTNGAGALYVAVEDSAGKVAVVTNADPAAVKAIGLFEWKVPLSSLTGVNLAKVKRLYIGVGDRQAPAQGGAGRMYIDDIRLTKP
ncbi:MAG: LamG domain-containing protein [Planctomycetes bacterium]|nr:LamG domain-containing protein [Planctomycetota bacterium]